MRPGGFFYFSMAAGDYSLLAFEDRNGNLRWTHRAGLTHWRARARGAAQAQPSEEQRSALGQLERCCKPQRPTIRRCPRSTSAWSAYTATCCKVRHNYLRVVDFDDPRFSTQRTAQGAWQPLDFLSEVGYGLYVLEPGPDKEPIVLLHGINDSPRVWRAAAAGIDRTLQLRRCSITRAACH